MSGLHTPCYHRMSSGFVACSSCGISNKLDKQDSKEGAKITCWSCKLKQRITIPQSNKADGSSWEAIPEESWEKLTSPKKVKETTLYDLLEVTPDASSATIRKQYYAMAMKYHPDKNPDDAHAEAMFKKMSEAYQILSDPTLRARYDSMGSEAATPAGGFMNAQDFFRQMFGGDKFLNLIGDISLGKILNDMMTSPPSNQQSYALSKEQQAELERLHKERVEMLLQHLTQKTSQYTKGLQSQEQLQEAIHKEALDLSKESYGVPLLHSIGYVYLSKSRQALGGYKWLGIPGMMHSVKEKGHIVSSLFDTIGAVRSATTPDPNNSQVSNAPSVEQEEKIKNALWKASNFEVEATLRAVCEKFLNAPRQEKEARARALKIIGKVYCSIN